MRRCPLCSSDKTTPFYQDRKRAIHRCKTCMLLFADASSHLPPDAELKKYQTANNKHKPMQQLILSLVTQLEQLSKQHLVGLNFGRVVADSVVDVLINKGHQLHQYDPFFAPDHQLLRQQYDFICCYKVFEHFRFPSREWHLLCSLLKPGGWIAINTQLITELNGFAKWHHKNNLTHVSFYQRATFQFLAKQAHFTLLFASNDLILVQKPSKSDITRDPSSLI
ncbi:methyltransferase domain-containing protein [Shewanella psychrotolerans]|uniref:methyltransferase domain-containing protein n=1 Tax=Shewanella psychrotolerans TaxID=2864206 RepID=UPI001C65E392|nr:methyltransferase domain-containing protein [Shewanella psychrotolerans]QYK01316.1 class I SAM-dependent methyltransferase [Shewanella psychrotolerans]